MKRSAYFSPPAHYPSNDELAYPGNKIRQTVIANAGYDQITAEAELKKGIAKAVSFGTLFLANPDLPKRFELDAAPNQPDRTTMFGGGKEATSTTLFSTKTNSISNA